MEATIPPECEHHLWRLVLLMPCPRHNLVTGVPAEDCFRMDGVKQAVKRDFSQKSPRFRLQENSTYKHTGF